MLQEFIMCILKKKLYRHIFLYIDVKLCELVPTKTVFEIFSFLILDFLVFFIFSPTRNVCIHSIYLFRLNASHNNSFHSLSLSLLVFSKF